MKLSEQAVEEIVDRAIVEERETCMGDVCDGCLRGLPARKGDDEIWVHSNPGEIPDVCRAHGIRARQEGGEDG